MPQMQPLPWLILFMTIYMLTFMIMNHLYYTQQFKKNSKVTKKSMISLNWKW